MTRKQCEKAGWTAVLWREPELVPIAWTAAGKVRSKQGESQRVVEKHAPSVRTCASATEAHRSTEEHEVLRSTEEGSERSS